MGRIQKDSKGKTTEQQMDPKHPPNHPKPVFCTNCIFHLPTSPRNQWLCDHHRFGNSHCFGHHWLDCQLNRNRFGARCHVNIYRWRYIICPLSCNLNMVMCHFHVFGCGFSWIPFGIFQSFIQSLMLLFQVFMGFLSYTHPSLSLSLFIYERAVFIYVQ